MEHLEENGKPCLYLVSTSARKYFRCARLSVIQNSVMMLSLQVFEFLSTDLKKYMDRNGKGPAHPLPADMVKVSCNSSIMKRQSNAI